MNVIRKPKKYRRNLYAYLLIFPGMLMIGTILVFPLARGILSSFFKQEFNSLELKEFDNFGNYYQALNDQILWMTLKNTAIWVVSVVTLQYLIGLAASLLLNKRYFGRAIARSLILIPWVIPTIAGTLTWRWMFDFQYGVINYAVRSLGLNAKGLNWLGSTDLALIACIITAVWKAAPFVTIVLLAGLQSVDIQLYEAASIDGANAFQKFCYITMPGIRNVSITCLILKTIWTFNQFDIVSIMTNGGPANSSLILPVYTYLTAFSFNQLNYAATIACIGILLILPIGVLYIIRNIQEKKEQART